MSDRQVGLIGATSFVGVCLLPLLAKKAARVVAFSRGIVAGADAKVEWRQSPTAGHPSSPFSPEKRDVLIPFWISVAPIWVLPQYFDLMKSCGVRKVVALSSTSRFTKEASLDAEERELAGRLIEAEAQLQAWAEMNGIEWVVLRPTLIYGLGLDKNISEIARFIRRFSFFPVLGKAQGLRQPVHVEDVAGACLAVLESSVAANRAYTISGGETLAYREMVCRIFAALGRSPRLVIVPLWSFRTALLLLRVIPRYRHWNAAMAERMNRDLVFDHSDAARDFGFSPRPFLLVSEDMPR